jgi:hypothetical protein
MTIHWKALEEHFLMVPFVFQFNHFPGKNAFFSKTHQFLKSQVFIANAEFNQRGF